MNEWNIQSRAHVCEACSQPFADHQPFHTLLLDETSSGLRRMDVCDVCWQGQFNDGARDRKGFVSHWQGVYELPPPPAPDAIQKETAETLLRKLLEQKDPQFGPAAFILAVMLERKRLLRVKEQFKRDGKRVFVYEQPKTGDLFTIADPDLHLNQLEAVQRDVAQLLEHGLPSATPAATAETPPSADDQPAAVENTDAEPEVETPIAVSTAAGPNEESATLVNGEGKVE